MSHTQDRKDREQQSRPGFDSNTNTRRDLQRFPRHWKHIRKQKDEIESIGVATLPIRHGGCSETSTEHWPQHAGQYRHAHSDGTISSALLLLLESRMPVGRFQFLVPGIIKMASSGPRPLR